MKSQRLLLALGIGLGLVLLLALALKGRPVQAQAGTCNRYVVDGGNNSPENDCSDPNSPCKTIQYALSWASGGETICVADRDDTPGATTYNGTIVITRSVILDGAWAARPNSLGAGWIWTPAVCNPESVILDGGETSRVISITNASPTIYCFTITGGNADGAAGDPNCGGGIAARDAAPIIVGNIIAYNYGCRTAACTGYGRGGGIYLVNAPATAVISNNLIANNVAAIATGGQGGGIYLENASPQVLSNTVQSNRASYFHDGKGGGIYLDDCYATVAENQVFDNIASSGTPAKGGGIYVNGGGGLIQSNVITHNYAVVWTVGEWAYGGGMVVSGSAVLVQDNLIARNEAAYGTNSQGVGGGVYVWGGTPRFVRNQVLSNTTGGEASGFGGGFALSGGRQWLEGNTIVGNRAVGTEESSGGGVRVASCHTFTLTNNIIAQNSVSATGSGVAISFSGLLGGRVAHNTIVANANGDGVGVYVSGNSNVLLYNNIVVSQTVGITNASPVSGVVSATHTLFEGNGANYGPGVTSTNEVAGPAGLLANYHLSSGSNAIGHATPLAWVTTDIDGDPRPIGPAPDVGADEARLSYIYLPLVLRNY